MGGPIGGTRANALGMKAIVTLRLIDWCGADRHSIKATLWWWDTERAAWGHCEGWRLNPFYQPAEVAEEQTRP